MENENKSKPKINNKRLQVTLIKSKCERELEVLKKVNSKMSKNKFLLAGLELLALVQQEQDFDIYKISSWTINEERTKQDDYIYQVLINLNNTKEIILYNELQKLTRIERKIFMCNVIVHIGRLFDRDINNSDLEVVSLKLISDKSNLIKENGVNVQSINNNIDNSLINNENSSDDGNDNLLFDEDDNYEYEGDDENDNG